MPRPKTGESKIQHIRIPDEDWQAFNSATGGKGAAIVRAFIAWYLRKRGSAMPRRPDAQPEPEQVKPAADDKRSAHTEVLRFTEKGPDERDDAEAPGLTVEPGLAPPAP